MSLNKERGIRKEFKEEGRYKEIEVLEGHRTWIESVIELSDGRLASGSGDGTVRVWERETGECVRLLEGHKGAVSEVIELDDMGVADLLSVGVDKKAIVWNLYFGRKELEYDRHKSYINTAIQLSNRKVASGGLREFRVWNVKFGNYDEYFNIQGEVSSLLEWDGGELVVGKGNGAIDFYKSDVSSKYRRLLSLNEHKGAVKSLIKLSSGRLASGADDGTIKIWEIRDGFFGMRGDCGKTLEGHTKEVESIDEIPDGKIVSGSFDGSVKIWDVNSGECLQTLKSEGKGAYDVRVLKDGKIASGHDDGKIRIWSNE